MTIPEAIEHFLLHSAVPNEPLDATTWLLRLDNEQRSNVLLRIDDPIALASAAMLTVDENTPDKEGLYKTLLELNSELLHCAYALQDGRVVLSGSQQLENLDLNEFQALIDDMTMALDNHHEALSRWTRSN